MGAGGACGKPYRALRHSAYKHTSARIAMEVARRALDEPGIEPGEQAIAICEQRRIEDSALHDVQQELQLRSHD